MRLVRVSSYAAAVVAALLMFGASPTAESSACATCGSERWPVKVLAPPLDAHVVGVAQPPTTTVASLNLLTPPHPRPKNAFGPPNEGHAVDVTACMYYVFEEPDRDYHLAMADLKNPSKTLVAEIPNTTCAGACTTRFKPKYEAARKALLSLAPVKALLQQIAALKATLNATVDAQKIAAAGLLAKPIVVEVQGVQFFDNRNHGTGGNDKGIEIHPVYAFRATTTTCTPPPTAMIQQQLQRSLKELP